MDDATQQTAESVSADPGTSDNGDLFLKLQGWLRDDLPHVREWRKKARESFQFYAGDQWSEEDKEAMRLKKRPPLVFNRTAPLVNAICGSEINNRREVQYIPREMGDALADEVLSSAAEWFRDIADAEDEESDAFLDAVVAGIGWTDTRLCFEENPDGDPKVDHIDPFEMVWDCNSRKANFEDSQRRFRIRDLTYDDAVELTGETDPAKLNASWVKNIGGSEDRDDWDEIHDQEAARRYEGGQETDLAGYRKRKYTIVEARWLENETYYRSIDPQTGQIREYSAKEFGRLEKLAKMAGVMLPSVKQKRKVVRRCFVGSDVLGTPDKPLVPRGLFGWEAITGYYDKIKNLHYGIVEPLKDPQRWMNKFFSQVMFILNSQSKGGIMAERAAFENDREAEESYARSDAITWLKQGGAAKIKDKPAAQFPQGFFALFQETKEAFTQVTGISPEFIGTTDVNQPGVLENTRRQASLSVLAGLFNALRRYRKRQGKVMLYLIQNHLSDGRLVRILGKDKEQYVPLTKEAVANIEYDIIIDDAPSSPNEKERTWAILMQLMPMVSSMLTPQIMLQLLEYSPLPASLVSALQEQAKALEQQNAQKPSPQDVKLQGEVQKHQLDMAGKQADLAAQERSAQIKAASDAMDLMIKKQKMEYDAADRQAKAQADAMKAAATMSIMQQRANATQLRALS